ncbi:MAG: hypothetical protein K2X39_08210, partial [Silvanigrellaceae bacterium]|nr:hypothetical protein [Silvanigrellaceae bacterium]
LQRAIYLFLKQKFFLCFCFLFLSQLILSCHSINPSKDTKRASEYSLYESYTSDLDFVTLNPTDFTGQNIEGGLFWSPVIFPLKQNVKIEISNLFTGFITSQKTYLPPPKENECVVFPFEKTGATHFLTIEKKIKTLEKTLFFLFDERQNIIIGGGIISTADKLQCQIPHQNISLLTKFGILRNKKQPMLNNQLSLILEPEKHGEIIIEPNTSHKKATEEIILTPGDILRIGRNTLKNQAMIFNSNLIDNASNKSFQLSDDIFLASDHPSKQIGINEYLKTSFFITKEPYSILLPEGDYVFTIIRNGEPLCFERISIEQEQRKKLVCHKVELKISNYSYIKFYQQKRSSLIFDGTIFPKKILDLKQFHDLYLNKHNYLLLIQEKKLEKKLSEMIFAFFNPKTKKIQAPPFEVSLSHNDDSVRLLLDARSEKKQHQYLFSKLSQTDKSLFMMAGSGLESFIKGAVPFFTRTIIYSNLDLFNEQPLFEHDILLSNGASIELVDPLPLEKEGRTIVPLNQQKVKIYLHVPAWNSTRFFEIYVNGALYKRKVFDKGKIESTYSVILEENFKFSDNAYINFMAWGEDYLPNFLSGTNKTYPIAASNMYCLQVSDKQKCWQ